MKKPLRTLLSVLLSILIAASCISMSGAAPDPGDPALPVLPTGKDVIQNPNTFCNPISLTRGTGTKISTGEPIMKVFNGGPGDEPIYLLTYSGANGYWWSEDFVDWTWVSITGVPSISGPSTFLEIDGRLYGFTEYRTNTVPTAGPAIRYTDDPKSGVWYPCGRLMGKYSNTFNDGHPLYDEETGRLFVYFGCSTMTGTYVVEYDVESFTDPTRDAEQIGEPVIVHYPNHHKFGWEIKRVTDYVYPYFRDRDAIINEYPWTEGPCPIKYNGKYYLLFASNGIEQFSYSHGLYVADDPMGPWTYNQNNPLTRAITGAVRGTGHGSIWVDKQNKIWVNAMLPYPYNAGSGTSSLAIYPCEVDKDGMIYADLSYGDHPLYLPGKNPNPSNDNSDQFTGWAQLSVNKEVEVSSTLTGTNAIGVAYSKECAVNEDPMSSWVAASGAVGEYVTVDLGAESDIRGIQILFDRSGTARTPQYTVEVSNDNTTWDLIIDKSGANPQDLRSDYIELPVAVMGRYVKLTNRTAMTGTNRFAVQGLRVFGNPDTATFTKVDPSKVKVVRSELDRMNAHLLWEPVAGASMYIVRYGIAPDKLHNSYKSFKDTYLDLYSLGIEPDYYFEVEAVNSGTPLYDAQQAGVGLETDPVVINAFDKKWALLSLDKEVETSSIYDTRDQNASHPVQISGTFMDYWPAYAVDENPDAQYPYWSADTGDAGEYITVDIGAISDIRGIQIQWNRADAFGFTVEVSNDNQNWTQVIDESANAQVSQTNYIELATAARGRYVKLTNAVPTPDNDRFAVSALRVFGNPAMATFTKVDNVKVVRSELNPHYAHLLWDQVSGAEGYVVRYGTDAANLDKSYTVFWNSFLDIPSLAIGQTYYFEVEAFSSGTPRWVENTYETRGRGVNFEFNIPGLTQQRFNYTFETYGRDEVYTLQKNLTTAGAYIVHQGIYIWQRDLTAGDLIGPDTGEPSVVDLDCMRFGSGTTPWGSVDMRVYPSPTGGRIELTLRYYNKSVISTTLETIVAGRAAILPVDVVFAGEIDEFKLGLYAPNGKLLSTIDVDESGRYEFGLDASDAIPGTYTTKIVGAPSGVTINCVAQPFAFDFITIDGAESVVSGAGAKAEYVISANNMQNVSGIELEFEVDGDYLSSLSFEPLDGFAFTGYGNYNTPIWWTNNGNIWTGKATLTKKAGSSGYFDIMSMTYNVKEGVVGSADVTLNYVKASYEGNNVIANLRKDTATTLFVKWYSKYDLNQDGVIDLNDLTYALQYLGVTSDDPEWEQAKVCNFKDDDLIIDISDLILILANYTIPYYS